MIIFEFHQEEHQIGDRLFPEKHYNALIDTDELDFETLCLELFELTKVAGFCITQKAWDECKKIALKQLSNKKLYVVDAFCGANKDTRMAVRFIMEVAWQAHFVTNMFIRPSKELYLALIFPFNFKK